MTFLGSTFDMMLKRQQRRAKKRTREKFLRKAKARIDTEQNRQEGIFDGEWYARTYPDVVLGGHDPAYHYIAHGHAENRNPGPNFDTAFYKEQYPDVVKRGFNPLLHYVDTGRTEQRLTHVGMLSAPGQRQVRHVVVREMSLRPGEEVALMVTHAPAGRLKPHVLPYIDQFAGTGLKTLLIVIADRPLELRSSERTCADGIIVRDNAGYDFGAWAHAFQLCPALYGAGLLVMTNDSIVPTADTEVFRAMMERVRDSRADITALTASHEYGWHVQSYFLAFKPKALSSWTFQHFMRDLPLIDDKDEVIRTLEVPFASRMQAGNLTVEAVFSGAYSANPTFFSWRELIEQGFPFIKLLMLRKEFAAVTDQHEILREVQENWPKVLEAAGFDIDLVRMSLRAAEISSLPAGGGDALLLDAQRYDAISTDYPLKIAYFGPWNYESGLGSASREMLCALRHTGVQMNCYPITKPFHIHRLICPALETLDFQGRPDIAIVHLNPDSWNLLSEEQRQIIRSAKKRIGYWVWETDTIPEGWRHDLNSVDRIWAPSSYCAEVFAAQTGLPVDVVHHPVRLPARIGADRESVLRRFGVDPKNRVILYIFDGASYVVRKNPEALIRAFAAAGLAARGWVLLLKTKHLDDRPDVGGALTDLAERTTGVLIVEASLHADEVTSLLAAADIYASPHCSEGFGLTVAEAMAVGVPVVVTDFAGTRDFVDAATGYPVPAEPWTLEQSHGHYLAGHGWARIDEDELAATLGEVVRTVDAHDNRVAFAGRARVADMLSYEAVAEAIRTSFTDLINQSGDRVSAPTARAPFIMPAVPKIDVNISHARKFTRFTGKDGLVPVPLNDDLSWSGDAIPEGRPSDWLVIAPGNSRISPEAARLILAASMSRPDAALFYADDVAAAGDALDRIRLKPDFDGTLLAAQDYIGAPIIVRRKTYDDVGGLDPLRRTAALYDLVLKVAEAGGAITRIPEVLVGFDNTRPFADVGDRRAALAARKGFAEVDFFDSTDVSGLLVQRRGFTDRGYPAVTLVIPTRRTLRPRSQQSYVEHLLERIAETDWPMDRLTVIIGDDIAGGPEWATRPWPFQLVRIETLRAPEERFNYAAKMNRLWREARDEQIVFLNDDATPCDANWLKALIGFAVECSVGGVGARLYYEDGTIQHAGMFPTLRTIAHAWLGWPTHAKTYQDWAFAQREWSAVTGAVFATRRSILDQVNGFEERFSLEFNDVDLCLRIRNLGYRIVYNPDAQFTHTEKASRGQTNPPGEEVALFLSRWSRWLDHDPASHPALSRSRMDPVAIPEEGAWYRRHL